MTKRMIKLVLYLGSKTSWHDDADKLQKICAPHLDTWASGTPVRVCMRAYGYVNKPVHMLNSYLSSDGVSYRLELLGSEDNLYRVGLKSLYAMLRPLTLTELAED